MVKKYKKSWGEIDSDSIPKAVRRRRESAPIDKDGTLQKDMLFSSPSYAAMFVIGKSANGLTSWKTADGTALRDSEMEDGRMA